MDFDTSREVRFESMRKKSLSSQILRRHEDLRTRCEREMKIYDQSKRVLAAEIRHSQTIFKEKLRKMHVINNRRSKTGDNAQGTTYGQVTRPSRTVALNEDDYRRKRTDLTVMKDKDSVPDLQRFKLLFSVSNVNGRDKYTRKVAENVSDVKK